MAKHVFVDNSSNVAAYDFGQNAAFTGNAVGNVGFWSLDLGDHLAGTTGEEIVTASGIVPAQFQVTQQTTGGYPYASPIIEKGRIKRISMTMYAASAKATTGAVTISNNVIGKTHSFKIVKLAAYSDYEEFVNPSGSYDDRVNQIRNYNYEDTSTTASVNAQALVDAINADANSFVSATIAGAAVTITAKDNGTAFKIIDNSVNDDPTNGAAIAATIAGTFGFTEGNGNGWQAVMAEKKALGMKGYHNRLILPKAPETFALNASTYDVVTIECDNGVQGDTGARKDNLIIEIYIPSAWVDGSSRVDAVLVGATSGTAAGGTTVMYQA
jgi:hypothetical protein